MPCLGEYVELIYSLWFANMIILEAHYCKIDNLHFLPSVKPPNSASFRVENLGTLLVYRDVDQVINAMNSLLSIESAI